VRDGERTTGEVPGAGTSAGTVRNHDGQMARVIGDGDGGGFVGVGL
jgi:hypothetical protein